MNNSSLLVEARADGLDTVERCPNCTEKLIGQFCAKCGQNQKGFDRFLYSLIAEAFEDVFSFDSRASKTLYRLLLKPGALTKEYFLGRRARYIQPLRLYFITSLTFFSLLSLTSAFDSQDLKTNVGTNLKVTDATIMNSEEISLEQPLSMDQKTSKSKPRLSDEEKSGINTAIDSLDLSALSEDKQKIIRNKLKAQIVKTTMLIENNPSQLIENALEIIPPLIFCLLPLVALLLKLTYFTTGRYYTEHLVLAVHNHSFIYIIFLIESILGLMPNNSWTDGISTVLVLWIPIYLYLSLKVTYNDGISVTFFKFVFLGFSYFILLSLTALVAMIIGVLTL